MKLQVSTIRTEQQCQPLAMMDTQLIGEYAKAMIRGAAFPPVTVFHDGVDYFLAGGFHGLHAARAARITEIECDVREGTLRDAILFSCSANAAHGWRRTNDDKRRSVLRLLNDPEWKQWSDRDIARQCLVGADMVGRLRPVDTVVERQYEPRTFVHPKPGSRRRCGRRILASQGPILHRRL